MKEELAEFAKMDVLLNENETKLILKGKSKQIEFSDL